MSTRNTIFATIFIIAFSIAFSASVFDGLPDQMASHWNAANQVDNYLPRFWGAYLMPALTVVMLAFFLLIPQIDPLKGNIAKFREYFNGFILLLVAFLAYIHVLTLLWNLGFDQFNMGSALLPALGLIFIFAGVMMRKARRNFFIGIRTPWTLSSDFVWEKTHQIGSTLFMISGALSLLGMFFPEIAIWLVLVPVLAATIFLVAYSYFLYQQETNS